MHVEGVFKGNLPSRVERFLGWMAVIFSLESVVVDVSMLLFGKMLQMLMESPQTTVIRFVIKLPSTASRH